MIPRTDEAGRFGKYRSGMAKPANKIQFWTETESER